ncbi:laminin subunit alpha lam-3 isoform X2 [Drosophila nasuta]|uniref:laminin subunit alpha lam-3 isoform X2 n=1 Tax=Drosophila nasuta TaxID=42062 RepID=UPI00295F1EAB|nr:laminin subunit alpha lam-3 isoform X2 [Drosophila nasuta]
MKTRKFYNCLLFCLLLILLMAIDGHCRRQGRQGKTKAQTKRLQIFSPAQLLKEYNSSDSYAASSTMDVLDENIMSWTGVRIKEQKPTTTTVKLQNPRRRKTKSGLLIESNIAEEQMTTTSAEFGSRSGKKSAQQRRRNGRLQRPNSKSNANAVRDLNSQQADDVSAGSPSGLYPPVFNVAPRAAITVNATCGQNGAEEYCKLVDAYPHRKWATQCGTCNAHSSDRAKQRPIESLISPSSSFEEIWWQSPTLQGGRQYEYVTITLDLKQTYQIFFIMLKSANSPRPASWILEKSLDGINYEPWQYFGLSDADCKRRYNLPGQNGKYMFQNDTEVICTTQFSKALPLENGELHVSLMKNRPGAMAQTPELMQFITARFMRIRLQGMHSTANLDNSVDWVLDSQSMEKRSFYSLKQLRVSARLDCNGNADRTQEVMGSQLLQCSCQNNACGMQCEQCCPLYQDRVYRPGAECEICECHGHALSCSYDSFLERGICENCANNTAGNECEFCAGGFYRAADAAPTEPCLPCSCNPQRSTGICAPVGGACHCLEGFQGPHCEECAPNHYGDDCRRCECDERGTMEGSACAGSCQCKANVQGETCAECATGYYDLDEHNPDGCSRCWCSQVSETCHSAKLQTLAFETLNDWRLTDIQRQQSIAVTVDAEQMRLIFGNELDEVEAIYWQAPVGYLGNRLTSYGARLQLQLSWVVMRGDTSGKPTTGPNVILCGKNGLKIAYADESFESLEVALNVTLTEQGWYHVPPAVKDIKTRLRRTEGGAYHGEPVTRSQFLSVMVSLDAMLIRAAYHTDQVETSLERAVIYSGGLELGAKATTQVEQCICPAGYTGLSCEGCAFGYKRIYENSTDHQLLGKCIPCPCNGHSNSCDLQSGNCGDCMHNTFGERCERCQLGFYGNPLQGTPHDCKRCACPLSEESNNFSPSCQLKSYNYMDLNPQFELIEHAEYICTQCPEGYTGDHCQVCDDGYYGNPMQLGSSCQRCNCEGGPCNVTTGACITCQGNTEGWHCERCKLGHWGDPAVGCEPCHCYGEGSESELCDSTDGQCLCRPRFAGQKCDQCETGFAHVELQCVPCNCDALGAAVLDSCNASTGQCECKLGVMGVKCQECEDGYFGMNVNVERQEDLAALREAENDADWELVPEDDDQMDTVACEDCQCSPVGSLSTACDKRSGQCSCLLNVAGRRCEKCRAGHWNLTQGVGCYDCQCDPYGSRSRECNPWTGQCDCKIGVGGRHCNECTEGFFGFSTDGCQRCAACAAEGQVCDPLNGRCICPKFTRGLGCAQCVPGTWGWQARLGCRECECDHIGSIGQHCAAVGGQCQCREGYAGRTCNSCAVGYFGYPECRRCGCDTAGSFMRSDGLIACDSNGQCPCKSLVVGLKCDTCMQSTFGLSALNPEGCTHCFCFGRASECEQSDLSWGHIRMSEARNLSVQQLRPQHVPSSEFEYIVVIQMAGSVSYREDAEIQRMNDLSLVPRSTGNVSIGAYTQFYQPLYFQLPPQFYGDRTASYGGNLYFSLLTDGAHMPLERKVLAQYPLVQLHAHAKLVLDFYENEEFEYSLNVTHRVPLHESYWKYHHNSRAVDRGTLMAALQNVRHIFLRAFAFAEFQQVVLHNVHMDAAIFVQGSTNLIAKGVERCKCPKRFDGLSCQDPGNSYYRWRNTSDVESVFIEDLIGRAAPCHCNGRSNECDRETGVCKNCRGNTGGAHCQQCADGFYGDPNSRHGCQACPCPETNRNFARGCNVWEGEVSCICKPGYTGRLCERCQEGFFGNPMLYPNSSCQECGCHPDGTRAEGCDAETGQCYCRDGVTGLKCNKCLAERHHLVENGCKVCDNCTLLLLDYVELVGHKLRRGLHNMDLTGIPAPYQMLSEYERAYDKWHARQQNYIQARQLLLGYDNGALIKLDAHAENGKFQSRKALATIGKRQHALNSMQEAALLVQHDVATLRTEIKHTLHNLHNYGQGAQHLSLPTALKQARFYLQAIQQHHQLVQDIRGSNECAWQQFYATGNASDAAFDQQARLEMLWRDLNQTNYRVADMRLHIDRTQEAESEAEDVLEHVRNLSGHVGEQYQQIDDLTERIGKHLNQSVVHRGEDMLNRAMLQQYQLQEQRHHLVTTTVQLNQTLDDQLEPQREVRKHWLPKAERHATRLLERSNEYARKFQPTRNGARIAMLASSAHSNISQAIEDARQASQLAKERVYEAQHTLYPSDGSSMIERAKHSLHSSKQLQREALQQMQQSTMLKDKLQQQEQQVEGVKRIIYETGQRSNNITSHLQLLTNNSARRLAEESMELAQRTSDQMNAELHSAREMQRSLQHMRKSFAMLEPDWEIKLGMAEENISLTKTNLRLANVTLSYIEQQAEKENQVFDTWNNSMSQQLQQLRDKIAKARHAAEAIDVSLESLGPKCSRTYLPTSYGLSTSNSLRLSFALSNHMGNSPLLHVEGSEGRHITLELYKRRVRLVWNLGGSTATITHPLEVQTRDPKFDDAWYQVEANRTLNLGSLLVRRMNNYGALTPASPVTGSTDAEHTRFSQSHNERILLGGYATKELTPGLNVVVHQVEVDNKPLGLWNFLRSEGRCGGAMIGAKESSASSVARHFNGLGYAQVMKTRPRPYRKNLFALQMTFRTLDENALLFLAVDDKNNRSVSVTLSRGRIMFRIDYGDESKLEINTTKKYNTGQWIKMEAAREFSARRSTENGMLRVNNDRAISGAPTLPVKSYMLPDLSKAVYYLGGVPPGFTSGTTKAPGADNPFLGCMMDVQVNGETYDPLESSTYFGVEASCKDMITKAGFSGNGYLELPSQSLRKRANTGLVFRTLQPDCLLLLAAYPPEVLADYDAKDIKGNYSMSLIDGQLHVWVNSGRSFVKLSSNSSQLNDGELHVINLIKTGRRLELMVDDEQQDVRTLTGSPSLVSLPQDAGGLYIGGAPPHESYTPLAPTFIKLEGAVRDVVFNNRTINFNDALTFANVQIGRNGPVMGSLKGGIYDVLLKTEPMIGKSFTASPEGCKRIGSYSYEPNAFKFGDEKYSYSQLKLPERHFWQRNFHMTFDFRSFYPNGMLYLSPGSKEKHKHYVALLLKDGQLVLIVRGRRREELQLTAKLNDGEWHHVTISCHDRKVTMSVEIGRTDQKTSAQMKVPKKIGAAQLLLVGGVPQAPGKVLSELYMRLEPFRGCLRRFSINNATQDLARPGKHSNVGQCFPTVERGSYFPGDAYAIYTKNFHVAKYLELEMEFRTSELSGILLSVSEPSGSPALSMEISMGNIIFSCDLGDGVHFRVESTLPGKYALCDNKWHNISALYDGEQLALRIDQLPATISMSNQRNAGKVQTRSPLYIGGLPDTAPSGCLLTRDNFKGCIRNVSIRNERRDWIEMDDLHNVLLSECLVSSDDN